MQKLSILTVWLALVLIGGWHVASAWQATDAANPESTNTSGIEPAAETTSQTAEVLTGAAAAEKAKQVLEESRTLLFTRTSIRAHLTQTVSLGDFRFRSEGEYRSADGFRYKLTYNIKLAQLEGTFLEISDGQMLHTVRVLKPATGGTGEEETEVTRRDLQRIKREAGKFLQEAQAIQSTEIALGGLPSILASLERCMEFDRVTTEAIGGQPVITLQGKWNTAKKDSLLQGLGNLGQQITPFVPDLARIAFTADTKFPAKVQYLKLVDPQQGTYLPMLTLSFTDIKFDEPVEFRDFAYIPPQATEVIDITSQFIEMIRVSAEPAAPPVASPIPTLDATP